ncbi:hypothetical protein [Arcobacter peruensis]|uniref:hypothetical protein n=1 Tax=Arcobacter peruensis TaxID=2320140 RepID=UPI000F08457D|nr:hypothetical protein [Arcobacter peruensis]
MKILKSFFFILALVSTLFEYLSAESSTNSNDALISLAKSKLGSPYVYAKTGPILEEQIV